ncbi:DUF4153 domain-containing protein [Tabrizicola sp.]|uniref:DUF4153 domain-containing protein n=1 Tax=Tabrizicola sp. TaxID=2005166 RepID=UPI002735F521|nr:DUF4153 domain-containing protein [Tabrizicola sp.]MDP3195002.1 DUF4153 domain-containing protein [Tabrizicola sp.]
MTGQIAARIRLALAGALGGAALWAAMDIADRGWLDDFPALALFVLLTTAFTALMALAGPIGLGRAVPRSLGLGVVVAALTWQMALRFDEVDQFLFSGVPLLAILTLSTLPLPFLAARVRSRWNDYPVLFLEAWSIVLRFAAAGAFTALVWLVIYLSDALLQIVGIRVIGTLLEHELVALALGGAIFGLGMAVIHDLADLLSPYVVLRVFRLFLPVVLAVMAVFLVALPFRGLDGLVSGLSPATLLLTMVGGGTALVSIAIDQADADATQSPLLVRCTQGLALILPLVAALALWAVWLRVSDRGWSPERLFVVLVAGLGLVYGLVYAVSVLRGGAWMERIRQGNIRIALGILLLAALWLSPVLNAERISAASQLSRFEAEGVEALDPSALRSWGKPGAAVLAALEAKSTEPGQEALAAVLAGEATGQADKGPALVAELAALLAVQPTSATGMRDVILGAAEDYQLQDWLQVCKVRLKTGEPGCLLVVADLLPLRPGEEAMLFLQRGTDYIEVSGLYLDDSGMLVWRTATQPDGNYLSPEAAARLLREYHAAPPPLTGAELNQLGIGEDGLLFLP